MCVYVYARRGGDSCVSLSRRVSRYYESGREAGRCNGGREREKGKGKKKKMRAKKEKPVGQKRGPPARWRITDGRDALRRTMRISPECGGRETEPRRRKRDARRRGTGGGGSARDGGVKGAAAAASAWGCRRVRALVCSPSLLSLLSTRFPFLVLSRSAYTYADHIDEHNIGCTGSDPPLCAMQQWWRRRRSATGASAR